MAATKKLEADFLNAPLLLVNKMALLVLSILNSGMKMKPPTLKLADKVAGSAEYFVLLFVTE
jgi:hypothetical protein